MNKAIIFLAAAALLAGATAQANCPDVLGVFSTVTGTIDPGRASEAWCGADGAPVGPGQVGNTINAESWDGAILGAQWTIAGMSVDAAGAILISDTIDGSGNGQRTYQTGYDGGQFWLAGDGPWTTDDLELNGGVENFLVFTTITFIGGSPVQQTSNITFNGVFHDCPEFAGCVIEFAIANAVQVWNSSQGGTAPADYPPFLCDAEAGEVFQSNDVTISIDCAVATRTTSWSALKGLYR